MFAKQKLGQCFVLDIFFTPLSDFCFLSLELSYIYITIYFFIYTYKKLYPDYAVSLALLQKKFSGKQGDALLTVQ